MMNTHVDIQFKGNGFSPKKLRELTKLPIEILVESGEIAKIGRHKGKPSPYGIGLLKVDTLVNSDLINYCRILIKKKRALKSAKVDEIIFDIETSSKNLETFSISSDLAKLLVSLNARLEFNQVEEDKHFQILIDNLLSAATKSELPNKQRLIKLLDYLIEKQDNHNLSIEQTYELVLFLLKNINKKPNEKIELIKSEFTVH